jgi:hypothetical protein
MTKSNLNNYLENNKCRISGSPNLTTVLDLGVQSLTGIFPRTVDAHITSGPLQLVWCPDSGLLQLRHSYDLSEMYGDNYGYRSSLNLSMVNHLNNKVSRLMEIVKPISGDLVLDIGSNDATLLQSYKVSGLKRVGIDPTGLKFQHFYTNGVELIPEFFSSKAFSARYPTQRPKIITSIAMFYDLEDPNGFVSEIAEILSDDGIWHFEQSYLPSMLESNAYDTVCHEHLEYYTLGVVINLLNSCGMRILDVEINTINGGSFAVTATKHGNNYKANDAQVQKILKAENELKLNTLEPFHRFRERVFGLRDELVELIRKLNREGKMVLGYGASTKGNVLLQFCGFTDKDIRSIVEVNPDKFGCFTPGSGIPIISEAEGRALKPDYYLVLPWHFKSAILNRERAFINDGGKMIFPLPTLEVV